MTGSQFQQFPNLDTPMVNPDFTVSLSWYQFFINMWQKLGASASDLTLTGVAATASAANTAAEGAQATANTGVSNAASAQTTANTALLDATTALSEIAAEVVRAEAAEALRALINNPSFTGAAPKFSVLFLSFASDALASAGGISLGQLYWSSTTGSVQQRRV